MDIGGNPLSKQIDFLCRPLHTTAGLVGGHFSIVLPRGALLAPCEMELAPERLYAPGLLPSSPHHLRRLVTDTPWVWCARRAPNLESARTWLVQGDSLEASSIPCARPTEAGQASLCT